MSNLTDILLKAKQVMSNVDEGAASVSHSHSYIKNKDDDDLDKVLAEMKGKDDKGSFDMDETCIKYKGTNSSAMDKVAEKYSMSKKK